MFTILLACAVGLLVIWAAKFFSFRLKMNELSTHFGMVPKHFLLGHYPHIAGKKPEETFQKMVAYIRDHGPNISFWGVGNRVDFFVSDPKDVEGILGGKIQLKKSKGYDAVMTWLGHGLLTTFGKRWFHMRKILTPTFHFKILEGYVDIFNAQNEILVKKVLNHIEANPENEIDVHEYFTTYALDNICETAMGVKINAQQNPHNIYLLNVMELARLLYLRIFALWNDLPTLYKLTPAARKEAALLKKVHGFVEHVIEERRDQLNAKGNEDVSAPDEFGIKNRKSFLDMLLQSSLDGKPLTNEQIREEVDTFMFAGHDTTTSAMTFTAYNLTMHPEIQEKVFEEQKCIFGDDVSKFPDHSSLQDMKYLEMVIKESLRLYPSVPMIGRETLEPLQLGNCELPTSLNITLPIYTIHRDPKVFPDPEKFEPERFTEEEISKRGPYDYIPFSAGPRNCIGQRFAMMEIKSLISTVVRNFMMIPTEKTRNFKYASDLVLRPVDGMYVKFEKRNY